MRGVANFLLNFAKTNKPRCADKLNSSFVTATRFGTVYHHKEYAVRPSGPRHDRAGEAAGQALARRAFTYVAGARRAAG